MAHRLDPLLRPRSIAVVGATERPHSVGRRTVHNLLTGGFEGRIYPVNPGRDRVLGLQCYPALANLPETVDHVAFAVSDQRIEAVLGLAIEHGAPAATIMSQLLLEEDTEPMLQQRVEAMVRSSGLLLCGANAMGFYNCRDGVWMCGFDTRDNHPRGGNVTLISHSGSGMSGIVDCEERIDFNLAVSTGQEISVAMHDYMDFAIEVHKTRVIGLFMETVRDPAAMVAVLEKANRAQVPVVAIKVGRTALSARLAQSHSGAVAGHDATYEALFDRYGVQRVNDIDAFTTALIMFAQPHPVADGGLVSLHDSGGERQLVIDLAERTNTPLAAITPQTTARLEELLDPGLPAVNPLDAWGMGRPGHDEVMAECLSVLMQDPGAALGAVIQDRGPNGAIYPAYADYLRTAHAATGKPAFLVANRQGTGTDPLVVATTREGFPVLDGLRPFLEGVNALLGWRDFCQRPAMAPPVAHEQRLQDARSQLREGIPDEAAALEWLRRLGLPAVAARVASSEPEAVRLASELRFPVAMKTAAPGLQHKSDHRGVHLSLADEDAVRQAYGDLAGRLGPRVLLAPMVSGPGIELLLGMTRDPQFGPLVVMGLGGTRVEALRDVVCALPPFDAATARRLLGRLQHAALFEHSRGEERPDLDSYCEAAALFSVAVASLTDALEEIDINPLIVTAHGCIAVDALVVPAVAVGPSEQSRKAL